MMKIREPKSLAVERTGKREGSTIRKTLSERSTAEIQLLAQDYFMWSGHLCKLKYDLLCAVWIAYSVKWYK